MSPEIVQKQPHSFPTDIWSLGVMLYFLITCKFPFGDPTNYFEYFKRLVKGRYDDIEGQHSDKMKDLIKLIKQMLEPNQEKRITVEGIIAHYLVLFEIPKYRTKQEYAQDFADEQIYKLYP